jgi:hypothetical protein
MIFGGFVKKKAPRGQGFLFYSEVAYSATTLT